MVVNQTASAALTASIDPYFFYNKYKDKYEDVSYVNPYDKDYVGKSKELSEEYNALNGVVVRKIFSCDIVKSIKNVETVINLTIDMYLYTERSVLFSLNYTFENQHNLILDNIRSLLRTSVNIKKDNKTQPFNISGYIFNDLLVNEFMNFKDEKNGMNAIMQNVDPFDLFYNSSDIAHRKTITNLGLDVDIYGHAFTGAGVFVFNFSSLTILDDKNIINTKDLKKICPDHNIFHDSDKDFLISNNKDHYNKHLSEFLEYRIYNTIVRSYSKDFLHNWYSALEDKSKEIIDNLDNKNELYWKKLRTDIEKAQLRFLSSNTRFNKILLQIKKLGDQHIYTKQFRDQIILPIEEKISLIKENMKEIKYGLENVATPGHTHDEQLLQQVTEKGNERILLLSFLAMSIPMIGAILSPTLQLQTKFISAIILALLPMSYIVFAKISYKRKEKKNINQFIKKGFMELQVNLSNMKKQRSELLKKNDDDAKFYLPLVESNIDLVTGMLEKLKKRMK